MEEKLFEPASGKGFLRYAGEWVGDDLEECLDLYIKTIRMCCADELRLFLLFVNKNNVG